MELKLGGFVVDVFLVNWEFVISDFGYFFVGVVWVFGLRSLGCGFNFIVNVCSWK